MTPEDREPSGRDRLSRKSEDWVDRQAGRLADRPRRTVGGWIVKVILLCFAIAIIGGGLGLVCGWFDAGKDIVSPRNVKEQYRAVIEDWQALEQQACNVKAARQSKHEDTDPTFLEDPGFAFGAKYREIVVDYNRRQANLFEAEKVGPKGYPKEAPPLSQMIREVEC